MEDADILQLIDAAAAAIDAAWTDQAEDDGVETAFVRKFGLTEEPAAVAPLKGRRVVVFPGPYQADPLDRADQMRGYTIHVGMVERYVQEEGDPATPDDTWARDRVTFFQRRVFDVLSNPALELIGRFTPSMDEKGTVDVLYDRDRLSESKTFATWATFPFSAVTTWTGEVPQT